MQDDTWVWRLGIGLTILGILAAVDYRRNPDNPTRIKEYNFLFGITAVTVLYGLLHDLVTYSISREYFAVGKAIDSARYGFFPDVALLAIKASWSAGLAIGIVLLVANNPSEKAPQLKYARLARFAVYPLYSSLTVAVILGIASRTFADVLDTYLKLQFIAIHDPKGFLTVWSIHIGTYVGALVGVVWAAFRIRRARQQLADHNSTFG